MHSRARRRLDKTESLYECGCRHQLCGILQAALLKCSCVYCACRVVMPDNRTIYTTEDGTNGVLLMFKADKPGDLSSGEDGTTHTVAPWTGPMAFGCPINRVLVLFSTPTAMYHTPHLVDVSGPPAAYPTPPHPTHRACCGLQAPCLLPASPLRDQPPSALTGSSWGRVSICCICSADSCTCLVVYSFAGQRHAALPLPAACTLHTSWQYCTA